MSSRPLFPLILSLSLSLKVNPSHVVSLLSGTDTNQIINKQINETMSRHHQPKAQLMDIMITLYPRIDLSSDISACAEISNQLNNEKNKYHKPGTPWWIVSLST